MRQLYINSPLTSSPYSMILSASRRRAGTCSDLRRCDTAPSPGLPTPRSTKGRPPAGLAGWGRPTPRRAPLAAAPSPAPSRLARSVAGLRTTGGPCRDPGARRPASRAWCPSWAPAGRALVGPGGRWSREAARASARTQGTRCPTAARRPARPSRRPSPQRRTPPATASAGDEPAGDERVTGTGAPDPGPRAPHGGLSACRATICGRTTGGSPS
jgi:hypothetical protein